MKRVLTVALAAALLLLSATSAQAQEKKSKKDIQDKWKIEKIAFLTDAMELTTSEAEKFWPVYNKAEAEKKASWKSTMDAYKALNSAIEAGKDDADAALIASISLAASTLAAAILSCSWMKLFTSLTSTMPSAIAA